MHMYTHKFPTFLQLFSIIFQLFPRSSIIFYNFLRVSNYILQFSYYFELFSTIFYDFPTIFYNFLTIFYNFTISYNFIRFSIIITKKSWSQHIEVLNLCRVHSRCGTRQSCRHHHLAIPLNFLPRAIKTLGKMFAECLMKSTQQTRFCWVFGCRDVCFGWHSAKALPSALGLCRVPLGKLKEFGSEFWKCNTLT